MQRSVLAGIAVAASLGTAEAAPLLLDAGPDALAATLAIDASNFANGQNFVDQLTISTDSTISGVDIFSGSAFGTLGQSSTVKVFADSAGFPGGLLDTVVGSIDQVDTTGTVNLSALTRKHLSVDIVLGPGTYWVGMSGTDSELAQALLDTLAVPSDDLTGDTFSNNHYILTAALQIEGAATVPEPNSLLLLASALSGLVGAALIVRHRPR